MQPVLWLFQWIVSPAGRKWLFGLMLVVLVIESINAVALRDNDFACHRVVGAGFMIGDPSGQEIYPLGRCLMDVAFAVLPYRLNRLVILALALAALYRCCFYWKALARDQGEATAAAESAALLATFFAFVFIILRDLDECGMQMFTLYFLSAGAYALLRQRPGRAGFWFATAATYKVTPILTLPFLLWKRQWKASAALVGFVAVWALVPALWLGPRAAVHYHVAFYDTLTKITAEQRVYPEQAGREKPSINNLSLQALLARYLVTFPPGRPLVLDHPLYVQFGQLDDATAFSCIRGVTLLLGLMLAWRFWPRAGTLPQAAEWAAVSLLCAIMSPICWKQHLVLILPAAFLLFRTVLDDPHAWRRLGIALAALIFMTVPIFNVFDKETRLAWVSYKADTIAAVVFMSLVLAVPKQGKAAAAAEQPRLAA